MPTRYNRQSTINAPAITRFTVPPLPTGFDSPSSPTDLTVPPVGIEDADVGLFNLFDKEISLQVSDGGKNNGLKKVPVIFTAGEKWALLKRRRVFRDRNNSLILPIVTVVRTSIQQSPTEDITGRGINQQTGELIVKRRLDESDRAYQGLINRMLLQHQSNVAAQLNTGDPGQVTTARTIGELSEDPTVKSGGVLVPDRLDNVYEFIIIPSPQFYTATYSVTFWAQYTTQMKQMLEQLIASFLPQGNAWRVDTASGYWFVATVENNDYEAEDNTDDFSQEERILKHRFTVKVPAYILASTTPGAPVPIRRYLSAPSVSFQIDNEQIDQKTTVIDPFLGADDPTLPGQTGKSGRRDQRNTDGTRLYPGTGRELEQGNVDDPAIAQLNAARLPAAQYQKVVGIDRRGNKVTKYIRVITRNAFTGETILAPDASLTGLTIVSSND